MPTRCLNTISRRALLCGAAGLSLAAGPLRAFARDLAVAEGQAGGGQPALGAWSKAAKVPVPLQEIYPAAWDGKLYLGGGIGSGALTPFVSNRLYVYDPRADGWSRGPDIPGQRHHITLIGLGDTLYGIGGYYGGLMGGWQMQSDVWKLSKGAGEWADAPSLPEPQAEMVTAELAGRIHMAGGRRLKGEDNRHRNHHRDVGDHLVFEPGADGAPGSWTTAAPLPTPRNSAAGGVIDGLFYVAGGRTSDGRTNLTAHEVYDPGEDKWREVAPMPLPQAGLAGAALGGRLYVFGGEMFNPERKVFPQAWAYDPQADKWSALPDMPTPRHGLGAVVLDGGIHVVGGATEPGGSGRSMAHEVFTPA